MPKLSDLFAEKAKAEIEIGGSKLKIEFYVLWRERFSPDEWTALIAVNGLEHLKILLPKAVISWDMVDDDGHAIPVTAEAIAQHNMPVDLLNPIAERVVNSDLSGKVPLRTSNSSLGS